MPSSAGWDLVFAASLTLLAVVAKAQGSGDSAAGTLQLAKERFTLKHVFAVMEEDPFSNGQKENLIVMLSDIPVPDEMRKASTEWHLWASDKATEGAIHGVILTIDPEAKIWDSGHVLTKKGFMFYTESISGDVARNLHFEATGVIGDHVAGKVSMKEPMHGMTDDDGPWQVDAQFSSAVVRRPAVSETLTGPPALSSGQYKAVMAFFQACSKKDVDAIRTAIDPKSREDMMKMFSGPNKDEMLNQFSQMAAEGLTFNLRKITVRGDSADLEFKSPKPDSGSSQTMHVVKSSEGWKIAR